MRIRVDAWQCELAGCEHVWLAASDVPPSHCAKCRKRGWNKGKVQPVVRSQAAVSDLVPGPSKVKMCQRHNQPAESCSGISCAQDRAARAARLGGR